MPLPRPRAGTRIRVKIVTVDTASRRVEGALKDGGLLHIAVWDVPTAFRWPQENEIWIVRWDSVWMLDHRVQESLTEALPLANMKPGQVKLDGKEIFDSGGLRLARVIRFTMTGDGTTTVFTLTHNLGTRGPLVQGQADSGGLPDAPASLDWIPVSDEAITVTFSPAPGPGIAYHATVIG